MLEDEPALRASPLAWLLERSPNILPIRAISPAVHLRERATTAAPTLSDDVLTELNSIASSA